MKVISTREVRNEMKTYFDLAEKERVVVKRGKKFVNLIVADDPDTIFVDDDWVKDFFEIPEEYRCNPFDVSPSGDIYWADKRNVEGTKKAIEAAYNGPTYTLNTEDIEKFVYGIQ
ncbi:MAG: hypothetical protein LBN93_06875 [Candidatus Symbiothrix sp.]|jgi:hypothetical protein|nr:hypothetical protein [Candidatus Symbiothrix sp.]